MIECYHCDKEATFIIKGYAETGLDGGYVDRLVCSEHVKSYQRGKLNGLEYIEGIQDILAGDRVLHHTNVKYLGNGEIIMGDDELNQIICRIHLGGIIYKNLNKHQLSLLGSKLRDVLIWHFDGAKK